MSFRSLGRFGAIVTKGNHLQTALKSRAAKSPQQNRGTSVFSVKLKLCVRGQVFIVKETAFEFLPLHRLLVLLPIAPETEIVLLSGGLKTRDKHGARRGNVSRRDGRYKLMTVDEGCHPKRTIPTHQGVQTKVTAVNCQQELIAPGGRAAG
jgi:hypothetical protein